MARSFAPLFTPVTGVVRGDKGSVTVTVLDPDGTAADLTGYTAAANVLTSAGDTVALSASIASNVVTVTWDATASAQFTDTNTAQAEIDDGAGDIRTIWHGSLDTIQDIV